MDLNTSEGRPGLSQHLYSSSLYFRNLSKVSPFDGSLSMSILSKEEYRLILDSWTSIDSQTASGPHCSISDAKSKSSNLTGLSFGLFSWPLLSNF